MMIWATLMMALREIRRNVMRSTLTMLGVVIGVAAVIAMVTIGEGATQSVTSHIASLGEKLLILSPGADRRGPMRAGASAQPFEQADADAIRAQIGGVRTLAPSASKSVLAVYGNQNWRTQVNGTTVEFFDVRSHAIASGRLLTAADQASGRPVCVIGATTKQELFGKAEAVGEGIRLGRTTCEVVGVLKSKGSSAGGMDQDDLVVMPLKAFQQRIAGNRDVSTIYVSVEEDRSTALVSQQIEALMRERRGIGREEEADFSVRDMQEIAETVTKSTEVLTALLGAIAAVSLLVGGIGIMNIMLVSVTERTREIGTRLAIGALAREVLLQFLIESVVLSTLGGLVGIGAGLAGAYAATDALQLPFVFAPHIVGLAFVFSALVGVIFGYLPAQKAARLSPIEALRHE
jgi:putative ABC transport system permease protein